MVGPGLLSCPGADKRTTGGQASTYVILMGCKRNVETPYLSRLSGRSIARGSNGGAGTGRWKKRRPPCNEVDRSGVGIGNITPRESGPTSIGWFVTRTEGKLTQETRQMSAGSQVLLVQSPA